MKTQGLFAPLGLLSIFLITAGGITYSITGEMGNLPLALIWIGLLLLLLFFYIYFQEIREFITKRSTKYAFNTAIMSMVFLAIIGLIAGMSVKYKVRVDLTQDSRYTLSAHTVKILKSLKEDVEAVAFYRSDERTRQAMSDLLNEYSYHSSKFSFRFVDPDRDPIETAKYDVTSYRTTVLKYGTKREIIGTESENKLTNSLLKLISKDIKVFYFVSGHGEKRIDSKEENGYSYVKEAIERENHQVKDLLLINADKVPDDAAVLVVSGPKKEPLPDEMKKLTAYINRGGKVLFMLDPGTVPQLVSYLKDYGFKIGDDIIIDKLSQVFGANYLTPVVTDYDKDHSITKEFNAATFFPLARSVEIDNDPAKGRYQLVKTGEASWAETNKKALEEGKAEYNEGKDKKGPVSITAVTPIEVGASEHSGHGEQNKDIETQKNYAKIIVIGDSDFVNNTNINLAGNKDFFLNTVNWLAEEADMISIRKKEPDVTPVILTASQARLIFWLPVIILPSFVLVTGIGMLTRRRLKK